MGSVLWPAAAAATTGTPGDSDLEIATPTGSNSITTSPATLWPSSSSTAASMSAWSSDSTTAMSTRYPDSRAASWMPWSVREYP